MIDVRGDFERVRDYIVGRLSDEERRTFEDRLVRDPELVREFEQSLRLREGLLALREQGYFAKAAPQERRSRMWLPALAAAAIAGVALLLWVQRGAEPAPLLMTSLETRTGADVAPLVAAHFTFLATRGNATPDLELPAAGRIEFRAAPAAHVAGSEYRVTLVRQDSGASWIPIGTVARVALSPDGYVHCYADASRLAPGSYALHIEADGTSPGTAETFPFNLRVPGTRPAP